MGEESGDAEDAEDDVLDKDEEEDRDEGAGLVPLHGEVGADREARCRRFSSTSSMWTMAETEDGRRLERASLAGGEDGAAGSPSGRWTEMALRRQLSHCCLWKTSLTCSVCDCAWLGSGERTRKMFLAGGRGQAE